MKIIESDFPVERMNLLAQKESNVASRKPVYNMHKWWARRVGGTFRAIILLSFLDISDVKGLKQKSLSIDDYEFFNNWFWGIMDKKSGILERGVFYKPVDLRMRIGYSPIVLDPFMGGGTTVVEALRLGCKIVGIDLNPIAWFVTKMEVEPVNLKKLDDEFSKLEKRVGERIRAHYKTPCPECTAERIEDAKVDAIYIFWVKKMPCVTCGREVKLYRNFILANPKGKKPTIFCPRCTTIFETRSVDLETTCPNCQHIFTPSKGYTEKGKYTCPECGQKYGILDAVRLHLPSKRKPEGEIWYPEEAEIFAIEYYCPKHGRGYKTAGEYEKHLYRKAVEDFSERIRELKQKGIGIFGTYIPNQKIPDGFNTKQMKNFGYEYFWQMFNERQLLCLSMLLEEILKVEDRKVREFMLMLYSSILEYSNTFCDYNFSKQMMFNMFSHHAFWPRYTPVENSVWGPEGKNNRAIGTGSFKVFCRKAREGMAFMFDTFERFVVDNKTVKVPIGDSLNGRLASDFSRFVSGGDYNCMILAKDAQDLSFISKPEVDAVITDPPYYDNVMYSELANFYYVWLRLGLKDLYEEFKPLYTPKEQEIIVYEKVGKTEDTYIGSLSNVFSESRRVLKDGGLLVFTYHHTSNETWAAILEAVLRAGFYVVATYPIRSEMEVSVHIREKEAREFDTIIIAKKRLSEPEPSSWEKLKDEIYLEAGKAIERVLKVHPNLSNGDKSTIILGKCLEVYSKHWPKVLEAGKPEGVDVKGAIEGIRDIIQDLYVRKGVPKSDRITEFYMEHLMKEGGIEYNELLKIVQSREITVSIDELKAEGILAPKGGYMVIVDPHTRGKELSERMESTRYAPRHYVDLTHLYYYLFKEGKRLPRLEQLGEFNLPTLASTLKYMAKELKEETYTKILNLLESREREPKGLEKFMR